MANSNDNSIEILKEERKRLMERVSTIDSLINLIQGKKNVVYEDTSEITRNIDISQGYDSRKPMTFKVLHVIKYFNRFLHSSEIRKAIAELDRIPYDSVRVSAILSQLRRSEKLNKIQIGTQNRNSFWGPKKWLDTNGNIKDEYMYDTTLLSKGASSDEIEF